MRFTITGLGALAVLVGAGLTGCGDGASAVESRDRTTGTARVLPASSIDPQAAVGADAGDDASGKTPLTANRRETVDAKIQRLYERNGSDFGASSPQDFLDKVTAFTSRPPDGVETVTRPNGDVLLYQPATNTFAVVARNGSPRTMFKPDDGPTYWAEQKAAAPTFGKAASQN